MLREGRCAMKIVTCYKASIRGQLTADGKTVRVSDALMKATADTCRAALAFCVDAFLAKWEELLPLKGVFRKKRGENFIHSTARVTAAFPAFDARFPYMPSGMRRAIVADALGMVSSYQSNLRNWEASDPAARGAKPVIGIPDRYELTFYYREKDVSALDAGVIRLKLFDGRAWAWYGFRLDPSEARYIARLSEHRRMLSPTVEKTHRAYRIRFAFEEKRSLVPDGHPLRCRVLACDLGINAAASWCVMTSDGTVHARGVIHAPAEEDRLKHLTSRVRMYQQAGKRSRCVFRWLNAANRALSIATAKAIMDIAELYSVDCLVFEHLDLSGRKRGGRKMRLHLWRARDIQARVETMAHRDGMRLSRICAWNTSRLAFDGSGRVKRGRESGRTGGHYSLCEFPSGKLYNCDLNAAQNIGARFFLREYAKRKDGPPLPGTPYRTLSHLLMVRAYYDNQATSAA